MCKLLDAAAFYHGKPSADSVIPELQDLKVGDTIKIFEQALLDVVALELNRIPSASSGQARTWSSSFLGRCIVRVSGNLNFPKEGTCDRIMQTVGASTDTFFIVTCSGYLCRTVL